MSDPLEFCNNCGACCYRVRGYTALFKRLGILDENGMCKNYDPWTKRCKVYANRPLVCQTDYVKPPAMNMIDWRAHLNADCDFAHQYVFGCPREPVTEECQHRHPLLEIQVETIAACNARCHFCPYKDPVNDHRRGKLMDTALFYKIVDEVATIPHISQFVFNGLGEPLLDRRIYDFIAYVHDKCPDMRTLLHTNGVGLTEPQRLKDAGLTNLVISLNAIDAKQHEWIMGLKGKFLDICDNIKRARTIPGWTVAVRAVYSQDRFTEQDVLDFKKRWGFEFGSETITTYETNWNGYNRTMRYTFEPNDGCNRALSQIYIAYDGSMHMCCMDPFGKIVFGNVNTQTIREIYNSEKYVAFRTAHAENRALDVPECIGCTRT